MPEPTQPPTPPPLAPPAVAAPSAPVPVTFATLAGAGANAALQAWHVYWADSSTNQDEGGYGIPATLGHSFPNSPGNHTFHVEVEMNNDHGGYTHRYLDVTIANP